MKYCTTLFLFMMIPIGMEASIGTLVPMSEIFDDESETMIIERNLFGDGKSLLPDADLSGSRSNLEELIRPSAFFAHFNHVTSRLPVAERPSENRLPPDLPGMEFLAYEPVAHQQIRWWTLDLINHEGDVIKHWDGQGNPPRKVQWDGTQEGWSRVYAGQPQTFVYSAENMNGESIKSTSNPIVADVFVRQTPAGLVIHCAGDSLEKHQEAMIKFIADHSPDSVKVDIFSREESKGQVVEKFVREQFMPRAGAQTIAWAMTGHVDADQPEEIIVSFKPGKKP